jgi:hypothetical protein
MASNEEQELSRCSDDGGIGTSGGIRDGPTSEDVSEMTTAYNESSIAALRTKYKEQGASHATRQGLRKERGDAKGVVEANNTLYELALELLCRLKCLHTCIEVFAGVDFGCLRRDRRPQTFPERDACLHLLLG